MGGLPGLIAACYPPGRGGCGERIARLNELGVKSVCSVLGKGHASIVLLADTRWGVAAVKVRRLDSRRESLEAEARALLLGSLHGATPKPLAWNTDVIVMEPLFGPSLGEALHLNPYTATLEALKAARALDTAGIEHLELHRPWRNVLFARPLGPALIVDLDSHSTGGCGNVPRLLAGLSRRLGIIDTSREPLRGLLARYKKLGCPSHLYEEIVAIVSTRLNPQP